MHQALLLQRERLLIEAVLDICVFIFILGQLLFAMFSITRRLDEPGWVRCLLLSYFLDESRNDNGMLHPSVISLLYDKTFIWHL